MRKRIIIRNTIFALLCISIGWYLKARFTTPAGMFGGGAGAEPSVFVSKIMPQSIKPMREYIGIVEPIESVDLRPQISGYVEKVLFNEGAFVNAGDLLFIIEQKRYIANVELRQAELDKAKANLVRIEKDYSRQSSLNKQQYASDAKLEQSSADLAQAKANVKQAQASLDLAKIDLDYTEIKAPISGVIGKALATEGNYVNGGNGALARIVQQKPIRVAFSISDKDYLKGTELGLNNTSLKILLANDNSVGEDIVSIFTNNEVDKKTATMSVFAEFANNNNLLVAGSYVKVLLSNKKDKQYILTPMQAIGEDKYGSYVFVVDENNMASQIRIKVGQIFDDKQEVTEGLKGGEMIIVQGLQKVKDGQKVRSQEVE